MNRRHLRPVALLMALAFLSGSASAALGKRSCVYHAAAASEHLDRVSSAPGDSHADQHADADRPEAHPAAHAPHHGTGQADPHPGAHEEPSGDDDHAGGCSCLGHCLGGIEPPVPGTTPAFRAPIIGSVASAAQLSDTETVQAQTSFLLPFANAPPALS